MVKSSGSYVEIEGEEELFRNIEKKLGRQATLNASLDFAKDVGKQTKKIVKAVEATYKDTGATVNETVSRVKPAPLGGYAYVEVGWKGPKNRVKLVHLNELGYTRSKNGTMHRIYPRGLRKLHGSLDAVRVVARTSAVKAIKKMVAK